MGPKGVVKVFGNIRQASKAIGVSRVTIYNWIRKGKISDAYVEQVRAAVKKRKQDK